MFVILEKRKLRKWYRGEYNSNNLVLLEVSSVIFYPRKCNTVAHRITHFSVWKSWFFLRGWANLAYGMYWEEFSYNFWFLSFMIFFIKCGCKVWEFTFFNFFFLFFPIPFHSQQNIMKSTISNHSRLGEQKTQKKHKSTARTSLSW